jgi:hypothetical protein
VPHEPPLSLTLSEFRGSGIVTIKDPKPAVEKGDGRATTTVSFGEPGEYVLRVQANDSSGDGGMGFQCCWTNALVKVSVRPRGDGRP